MNKIQIGGNYPLLFRGKYMGEAKFNKIFQSANESQHRYKIMYGSAGSGKSHAIATDYIIKLSSPQYGGCSLLVVRGVEVSHLNSTYAELTGAVDRLGLGSITNKKGLCSLILF